MTEFIHWFCGNCQIRIYFRRHYGYEIDWHNCQYVCEYATAMRCSTEKQVVLTDECIQMIAEEVAKKLSEVTECEK